MKDQAARLRELLAEKSPVPPTEEICPTNNGNCKVVAITSGKGGVGKTTISVNLAMVLAELPNSRVLILDADLGLANVDVMLGIQSGRHLGHLMHANCSPEEVAIDGPGGVAIISGGSGLHELADSDPSNRRALINKLIDYFQRFNYVLIDTSPGIGSNVMDFLKISDDILIITSSEPTSIRDTYAAIKTILHEIPGKPITLVINAADVVQSQQAVKAIDTVSMKFIGWHSNCWYHIDNDPMVSRSVRERKAIVRSYPRSAAAAGIRRLAGHLIEGNTCP